MMVPEVLGDHSAEQRTSNFVTSVVEVRWIREGNEVLGGGRHDKLALDTVYHLQLL
jgi:hypothetical protein